MSLSSKNISWDHFENEGVEISELSASEIENVSGGLVHAYMAGVALGLAVGAYIFRR